MGGPLVGWEWVPASSVTIGRIEIYTGRPLRVIKNKSNDDWANRESEMRELLGKGIVPIGEMMKTGAELQNPIFLFCDAM